MILILLALLFILVSPARDPCRSCPLPVDFAAGDSNLCPTEQNDTSISPTLIRYAYGPECYLQMIDCPAYDIITGSQCIGILPPQKALKCVDGKFRTSGMSLGYPIDKIRCNAVAVITPVPPSDCSPCYSPWPFTACGYNNLTVPYLAQPFVKDGRCYLNFNNSHPPNCAKLLVQTGPSHSFGGFEDKPCYVEEETNPVAICENNMFQINGRDLVSYQCAEQPAEPTPEEEGCGSGWKYLWATDSYFKLGYNKTHDEAKAACIADGGQLASIHSEEENDFIILMLYMKNKAATLGVGMFVWIGVEVHDGIAQNIDGTPFDYSKWSYPNPSGDGSCVRMTSTDYEAQDVPGIWNDLRCSATTQAYACRKNTTPETVQPKSCSSCVPIMPMPQPMVRVPTGNITITYDYSSGCMVPTFTCTASDPLYGTYLQIVSSPYLNGFGSGSGEGCGQSSATGRYKCTDDGFWLDERLGRPLPPYVTCLETNPCQIK